MIVETTANLKVILLLVITTIVKAQTTERMIVITSKLEIKIMITVIKLTNEVKGLENK